MLTLTECTRPNTCYDCTDSRCTHHGDKGADCPKYRCDRPEPYALDCEHCAFIERYIEDERRFYKAMIFGYCKNCKHHNTDTNKCDCKGTASVDLEMTTRGFLPVCEDYEERERLTEVKE